MSAVWLRRGATAAAFLGVVVGGACAADVAASSSKEVQDTSSGDENATATLLAAVRTENPVLCSMVLRAVDTHGWSRWDDVGRLVLDVDTVASRVEHEALRERAGSADVAGLEEALRDPIWCVRRVAATVLARLTDPAANAALRRALDDTRADVRVAGALGLGLGDEEGGAAVAEPLLARLRDTDTGVRQAAAWALGALKVERAEASLITLLARDTDPRVRQTAAWALGQIGGS